MFGDCTMPVLLGYGMLVYIIASIFYMFLTCVTNVGTPFKDAVSKYPELLEIKKKSVGTRSCIFYSGVFIGILVCIVLRPFKKCGNNENDE